MGKWKVENKGSSSTSKAIEALTLGFGAAQDRYECTNKETGEKRDVYAYSREDVGRKLGEKK